MLAMGAIGRWFNHIANTLTLAQFLVPAGAAVVTAAWGWTTAWGYLPLALAALFVFSASLWSWIGIVWLLDRANRLDPTKGKTAIDCSWGIRLDNAIFNQDIGNPDAEWQMKLHIRNVIQIPLKIDILERKLVIEGRVPDIKMELPAFPAILVPGEVTQINFPPYKKGTLPDKDRLMGEIDISIRYGYPDGPYTRLAIRKLTLQVAPKPPIPAGLPPGMQIAFPQMGGPVGLVIGPREADRDEPYIKSGRFH